MAVLVASSLLLASSVEAQDLTVNSTDCASCEASVETMLSSLYTWVWGGESEYCKRDFPEASAASARLASAGCAHALEAAPLQVWAGFVDTFSDTLNARGAAVKPLGAQVHRWKLMQTHTHAYWSRMCLAQSI